MKNKRICKWIVCVLVTVVALCGVLAGCADQKDGGGSSNSEAEAYNMRLQPSTAHVGDLFDRTEIFHDQADVFMTPLEPTSEDNVTVRLRLRRGNAKKVTLRFTVDLDRIDAKTAAWHDIPMLFEIADPTMYYDYWVCIIPAQAFPYKYYFVIENDRETVYYDYFNCVRADTSAAETYTGGSGYYVMPDFATPDWAKGCIWYSVMPDSFFNADTLNDKTRSGGLYYDPWGTQHTSGISYFGGDLLGVQEKIDYMKSFHARGVFINPIWYAHHNAGYGSLDMEQIDSCFGNDAMLTELADTLHDNGMKIMLDGVFTYASFSGTWYNQNGIFPFAGAVNPGDPYYDIYFRDSSGTPGIVWGNPRLDFSNKLTRDLVYATPTSVMQYYLLEHHIDGWRLDVGPDLKGSDEQNWGTPTQIIQDMRRYLKAVDSEMLLCSENGGGTMYTDYALDTAWNFDYYFSLEQFFKVKTTASSVANLNTNLYSSICTMPKPIANCSYNITANHDFDRALTLTKNDYAKVMGATIVNFTFTGAPCIYFGDEVGMNKTEFFNTMEWDPTVWNYDMVNLYHALADLRTEYEDVYKDGTVRDLRLNEDSGMLGFARWKGNQKVLTVMNPFENVRTAELDVHCLELADGTVLTDYLSGRTYVIEQGKITVDVGAGGIVLVNGKVSSKYAGKYTVHVTGEDAGSAIMQADGTMVLSGNGAFANASDTYAYAYLPIYNNGGVSSPAIANATYALQIRSRADAANGAFYAAAVNANGTATVLYRTQAGAAVQTGATVQIPQGAQIAVERGNNNVCAVYFTVNDAKTQAANTAVRIDGLQYAATAGLSPTGSRAELKNVSVYMCEEQRAADFTNASDSMMFIKGDASKFAFANGVLTISADEKANAYLTGVHITDFTVKTKLTTKPAAGSQGVAVYQSENDYILLGRTVINNEQRIALMQYVNGTCSVIADHEYDVSGDVTLQLEKVGYYYYAKYSTDGVNFAALDGMVPANYSQIFAGVLNVSDSAASFDYFCFGNAIEDGKSYADHKYYGAVSYYSQKEGYVSSAIVRNVSGGKWQYTPGGLLQTSPSAGQATLSFGSAQFRGFKADYTLRIMQLGSADAIAEYRFGQQNNDPFYAVRLHADGTVSLRYNEQQLAESRIPDFSIQKRYRFMLTVNDDDLLSVFVGEHPVLLLQKRLTDYAGGTQSIVHKKCALEITSFNTYHYSLDWLNMNGGKQTPVENYMILSSNGEVGNTAFLSTGVSDMLIAANVRMQKQLNIRSAQFGYLLNTLAGGLPADGGILVSANDTGTIRITEKGKVLAEKKLDYDYRSFFMILAVENGKISVYIDAYVKGDEIAVQNPSTDPVLVYDLGYAIGGAVQMYTSFAQVTLVNCGIYGLRPQENYKALDLFNNRVIDSPNVIQPPREDGFTAAGKNTLSWDFTDKLHIEGFTAYGGAWYVDTQNRCLVGLGSGSWTSGVTINAGRFENYELHYKIKAQVSGAWAGALLNKSAWRDNHDDGGLLLYTNGSGQNVFYGRTNAVLGTAALDADGYWDVVVKVYGTDGNKTLSVTVGGSSTTTRTIEGDMNQSGFVSLVAGNCVAYFRDVSIRALTSTGAYA